MLLFKRRLIGRIIGAATAVLLMLAMMPNLAWAVGPPQIDSITPDSASPGDEITITGSGFGGTRGNSVVRFGAVEATEYGSPDWSDSEINVKVPDSAATGEVKVIRDDGGQSAESNAVLFTISLNNFDIYKTVFVDGLDPSDSVTVSPGETVTYKIDLVNSNGETKTNIEVVDTLPEGFTYIGDSTDGDITSNPTEDPATNTLTWSGLEVPVEGLTFTYSVTVNSDKEAGDYVNSAQAIQVVDVQKNLLGEDTANVTVVGVAVTIEKTVSKDGEDFKESVTVNPGELVYFKLEITNDGEEPEPNLFFSDALPAGFIYQGGTSKIDNTEVAEPTVKGDPQIAAWSINGKIEAGAKKVLTFQAKASSIISAKPYVNWGSVYKAIPRTEGEAEHLASDSAEVLIGISVKKEVSVDGATFADEVKVGPGAEVFYRVTVSNPTDDDVLGIEIKDSLPASFYYIENSAKVGDKALEPTATMADPQELTWQGTTEVPLNIPKKSEEEAGKLVLTYKVKASTNVSETNKNKAEALLDAQSLGFDEANVIITLGVKKEVSTDGTTFSDAVSVTSGATVYYRVTIENDGSDVASLLVEDTLPSGFTYQIGSATGTTSENPAINGQKLTWSNITAKKGETILTFKATVSSIVSSTPYVNTVEVKKDNASVGKDTADVTVTGTPNLSITKSVNKGSASPNDTLTYTIHYGNTGSVELTNVVITDGIPADTSYVAGSADSGGVFDQAVNALTWTIGSLAVNASGSVSFQALIGSSATGTITNTASIDTDQTDVKTATASTTITVVLATTQQPATLSGETGHQAATETAAAQQLPTTLPKTGINLLGYVFGAVILISSGFVIKRLGSEGK